MTRPVCAPNVVAKEADAPDRLADDDRGDLVEADAAVGPRGRRCREGRALRRGGRADARASSPSARAVDRRQDFVGDELVRGLRQ